MLFTHTHTHTHDKPTALYVFLQREHSGCKQLQENIYWKCQSSVTQKSMPRVEQLTFLFLDMCVCFPRGRRKGKDAKGKERGEAMVELLQLIETLQKKNVRYSTAINQH